jgi:WD40 repeat protein
MFSPDNSVIFAGYGPTLSFFDRNTLQQLSVFKEEKEIPNPRPRYAFSPDGSAFAVANTQSAEILRRRKSRRASRYATEITILDRAGKVRGVMRANQQGWAITACEFSADGQLLATSSGWDITVWSMRHMRDILSINLRAQSSELAIDEADDGRESEEIHALKLSPDGELLVAVRNIRFPQEFVQDGQRFGKEGRFTVGPNSFSHTRSFQTGAEVLAWKLPVAIKKPGRP